MGNPRIKPAQIHPPPEIKEKVKEAAPISLEYEPVAEVAKRFGISSKTLLLFLLERKVDVWANIILESPPDPNVPEEIRVGYEKIFRFIGPRQDEDIIEFPGHPGFVIKVRYKNSEMIPVAIYRRKKIVDKVTSGFLKFIVTELDNLKTLKHPTENYCEKVLWKKIDSYQRGDNFICPIDLALTVEGYKIKDVPDELFTNPENYLFIHKKDVEALKGEFQEVARKIDAGKVEIYSMGKNYEINWYGEKAVLTKSEGQILKHINENPGVSDKTLREALRKSKQTNNSNRLFEDWFKTFQQKNKNGKELIRKIIHIEKSANQDTDKYSISKKE